jgi:malate/lactate dehydrogenase
VSAVLDGEYGLSGVSLGVPCVVSRKGVERVLEVHLPAEEQSALASSAAALQRVIESLESRAP